MDEILIGEKRYVSSKRAAKMTGYAKDYVGQLCREGRVPARLVGRSWYVLESAIQDHRFRDQKIDEEGQIRVPSNEILPKIVPSISPTWENPRYEASPSENLPSLEHEENPEPSQAYKEMDGEATLPERLQDSWKAWFDSVAVRAHPAPEKELPVESIEEEPTVVEEEIKKSEEAAHEVDIDTNVPIRVVHEALPVELLPNRRTGRNQSYGYQDIEEIQYPKTAKTYKNTTKTLQSVGMLFALILLTLAAIGTGYFDTYVRSFSQASIISGISTYNK